jgi:hypothetical protein
MSGLDARRLDVELLALFKTNIDRLFLPFDADAAETYRPEIDGVLQLLLWGCVVRQLPTPGMAMLNLRYAGPGKPSDAPKPPRLSQRVFMGVAWVLVPWAFERLRRVGLFEGWGASPAESLRGRVWRVLERLSGAWKFVHLWNL